MVCVIAAVGATRRFVSPSAPLLLCSLSPLPHSSLTHSIHNQMSGSALSEKRTAIVLPSWVNDIVAGTVGGWAQVVTGTGHTKHLDQSDG